MPNDAPLDPIHTLWTRLSAQMQFVHEFTSPTPFTLNDTHSLTSALRSDGSWPDIDYAKNDLKDWTGARHLQRLLNLAITLSLPSTHPAQHSITLHAILRGLDHWYALNPQNPNWWWNQIGAPLLLADILLCIKNHAPPSYIQRAIPSLEAHTRGNLTFTGQNLVWISSVQLRQGVLTNNSTLIKYVINRIAAEVRLFPHQEGIQPDFSFHQHGKLLYNGGYGQNFAMDIARLLALTDNTPFALPPHTVDLIVHLLLDGDRWMVRGRTFDPSASGREISRPGHNADRFRTGLRFLTQLQHPRQSEALASLAVTPESGQSMVNGNKHFWCSDFMTHHRPGYYMSVRMTSSRILGADGPHCGGEGRVFHHMADGATHLMHDGDEYRDIYPVWNWRHIPGATIAQHTGDLDPAQLVVPGQHAFAGGASDGSLGCAAIDFSRQNLHARKAWFFFDQGLVALGAAIHSTDNVPIHTTINQCHLRGPVLFQPSLPSLSPGQHTLSTGQSLWHDGFTYLLLDGQANLHLGPQSGAWSDCGVDSPAPITLPVFNFGINHGTCPAAASYAYAILHTPGLTSNHPIVILVNNSALQAVWHAQEHRGHAVFYEPCQIQFPDGQHIATNRPCILLYHPPLDHREGRSISLTVAQPQQQHGSLTLSLTGPIAAHLTLPLPTGDHTGASQTITLALP